MSALHTNPEFHENISSFKVKLELKKKKKKNDPLTSIIFSYNRMLLLSVPVIGL